VAELGPDQRNPILMGSPRLSSIRRLSSRLACLALAGALLTGCGGDQSAATVAKAKRHAAQIIADANQHASAVVSAADSKARADVAAARTKVRAIVGPIKAEAQQARADLATARQKLSTEKDQVASESSQLSSLQAQVSGTRAQISKDSFAGTGTFLVNKEINPGTYQAAASSGCYWARLASADTSNIIDNNNSDGPIVVQIASSDVAFEDQGCATFHRTGP
jgi:hypothetical protein